MLPLNVRAEPMADALHPTVFYLDIQQATCLDQPRPTQMFRVLPVGTASLTSFPAVSTFMTRHSRERAGSLPPMGKTGHTVTRLALSSAPTSRSLLLQDFVYGQVAINQFCRKEDTPSPIDQSKTGAAAAGFASRFPGREPEACSAWMHRL
ncbi:MAG TPA: hypothetical protein VGF67_15245 [Ktedonobacteraceae bacterium]|jgi:hypothetical protein